MHRPNRARMVAVAPALLLMLGACAPTTPGASSSPSHSVSPTLSSTPSATAPPDSDETAPPRSGDRLISSRIGCDWRVPGVGATCAVRHPVVPPIAPPPAAPLPTLYAIGEGTHPTSSPPYDQLSFRFTGGFPSYEIAYVSALTMDGSGAPVPLSRSGSVLRVVFRDAQAHDANGRSTVVSKPSAAIGLSAISQYAPAGDFEGTVTFGIGVGGSSNAGVHVPVRVYEVEKIEQGRHLYVIAVQVDGSHWR